jgi:hypothetical protein
LSRKQINPDAKDLTSHVLKALDPKPKRKRSRAQLLDSVQDGRTGRTSEEEETEEEGEEDATLCKLRKLFESVDPDDKVARTLRVLASSIRLVEEKRSLVTQAATKRCEAILAQEKAEEDRIAENGRDSAALRAMDKLSALRSQTHKSISDMTNKAKNTILRKKTTDDPEEDEGEEPADPAKLWKNKLPIDCFVVDSLTATIDNLEMELVSVYRSQNDEVSPLTFLFEAYEVPHPSSLCPSQIIDD